MIADPINLLDCSPVCDGAAAVVLVPDRDRAAIQPVPDQGARQRDGDGQSGAARSTQLAGVGSGGGFGARRRSSKRKLTPADIDFFEVHDAFSITAVASLEASGFAEPGKGVRLGLDGEIGIGGKLPLCTMGGLKARGHPVGATGMYQIVEAMMQLRGRRQESSQRCDHRHDAEHRRQRLECGDAYF